MEREELIFNYLDGLCSEQEQTLVKQLLETDNEFNHLFQELKQANDLMFATPIVEAPEHFSKAVMKSIKAESVTYMQESTFFKVLAASVVLLCLLFGLQNSGITLPKQLESIVSLMNAKLTLYTILLMTFFAVIDFVMRRTDGEVEK